VKPVNDERVRPVVVTTVHPGQMTDVSFEAAALIATQRR
jgi:hypothetical protein